MVANIKFTVLGFFFAWMMMVAFSYLPGKVYRCCESLSVVSAWDADTVCSVDPVFCCEKRVILLVLGLCVY